jgi:alkylation response protein AidB-like acyl-CoA dehydrogenase
MEQSMKTNRTPSLDELLERAAELEPLVREYAPKAEADRRLSARVADALRDAGFYRMFRPHSRGGMDLDPVTGFRLVEEFARMDSAAGWNLAIANATEPFAAWYCDEVTQQVFGQAETVMAGAWNPPRKAIAVDGGYRITGTTVFSSNCHAATWLNGLAHVYDGDTPQLDASGSPQTLLTLVPMYEATIVENWNTLGMAGTGSHDVVLDDVFVPLERAVPFVPLEQPSSAYSGPFHRLSIWPAVAAQVPPALGIARAAIDDVLELAMHKTPVQSSSTVRHRSVAQMQIAQAEGELRAAQASLYSMFDSMWQHALDGGRVEMQERAQCQIACSHAVVAAARAVDLVHAVAGASAIRNEQSFQKYFRDIHVITQHAFVGAARFESAGQVLLGLESDWPFFNF